MVGNENLCNVIESFRTGINGKHIHPPIIAIEPTSKCNMDCIMCPNSEVENKVMNHRLFTSIISQIKNYAKAILFYYRGEPLLNPDLSKMINYASSETDAKLFLSTNGSLLDKKNSMDIIKSGLDEIIISLDAYSPQTFAKIKGRNELTSIKNNVLRLVKINKKYDNKLDIAVKMISMVSNENEVEKFRDYWQNKVDRVEISKSNIILNLLSRNKMNFGGSKLNNNNYLKFPCADLWFKCIITANGNVVKCCNDFNEREIIGNITKDKLVDIWNSSLINEIRESHQSDNFKCKLCEKCNVVASEWDEYSYFPEFNFRGVGGRP